jgi:hypothetical protein
MARPKGIPKTGGKQKGYTSEPVKKAQELFVSLLEGEVPNLQEAFEYVRTNDPAKYLDIYAKFAQFFAPKKTELSGSLDSKVITVKHPKDDNE